MTTNFTFLDVVDIGGTTHYIQVLYLIEFYFEDGIGNICISERDYKILVNEEEFLSFYKKLAELGALQRISK